jgi:LysR family glycine cleavage system transcriptional activator
LRRLEPFGAAGRLESRNAYWLVPSVVGQSRPEVAEFARWVLAQAELTRNAMEAATHVVKS